MRRRPVPPPRAFGPLVLLYLALAVVASAALRLAGRGWVGAITAGIVLAGAAATLVMLVGYRRR